MEVFGPITDGASGLKIRILDEITRKYPSQWEGQLVDGRGIFIRYRGVLQVWISEDKVDYKRDLFFDDAVKMEVNPRFRKRVEEDDGGGISLQKVLNLTGMNYTKIN